MVELVTLNEALPGDSPDYQKEKRGIYNIYKKFLLYNNKEQEHVFSMHLRLFLAQTIAG